MFLNMDFVRSLIPQHGFSVGEYNMKEIHPKIINTFMLYEHYTTTW